MKTEQTILYHEIHHLSDEADWLVFIHGAASGRHTFHKQVGFFEQHFNLVMLDLRDHGSTIDKNIPLPTDEPFSINTIAQDVLDLLDFLNITKTHFIAVSMGSVFMRIIEEKRPSIVKKIVLGGGIFSVNWKLNLVFNIGMTLGRIMSFQRLYNLLSVLILPKQKHRGARRLFMREVKKVTQEAFERWLKVARELRQRLIDFSKVQIDTPCLVIMGSEDHVFLRSAKAYAQRYDNISIEILPQAGHIVHIERGEAFNQVALAFLENDM
ncbi:MAG: alpha/beta fold hydrolase [Chitinophagales bacterium]